MILRNYVPVKKDGETIAMLYGVVDLKALPKQLHVTAFNEKASIYVIDGNTGEFIVDTWHDTLGNLSDMGSRTTKSGYSHEKMIEDVTEGNAGQCIFESRSTGGYLYFCYGPANVNNWSVGISVSEGLAFDRVTKVNVLLMGFISLEIFLLAAYFIYIIRSTKKELLEKQRLAERDLLTGLLNRNCYENNIGGYSEKCASSLSCIFVDVNGLHELNNTKGHDAGDEMLKAVANGLHGCFEDSDLYRIGGDEFVAFVRDGDEKQSEDKLSGISARLTEQGYHISIGIYSQSVPVDIDSMIKEAERRMYEQKREYYSSMGVDRRARR